MPTKQKVKPVPSGALRVSESLNAVEAAITIQAHALDLLRPLKLPPEIMQVHEASLAGLKSSSRILHRDLADGAQKLGFDMTVLVTQFGPGTDK